MPRQILIELIRDSVYLPQSAPRHGREVVVLIMQTYVIGKIIENPVIRECFRDNGVGQGIFGGGRDGGEDIMLRYKMPRTWMQTPRQETR
jgi:hypothetical protein